MESQLQSSAKLSMRDVGFQIQEIYRNMYREIEGERDRERDRERGRDAYSHGHTTYAY